MSVLLLLGPTAAGKSAVAVEVGERLEAEVISADARVLFRELVIGTDRPSPQTLRRVPHHLVGFLSLPDRYDAAQFRTDCERLVGEIHARGKRAVVVGGSTLYIRALTRGLFPGPSADLKLRQELEKYPLEQLRAELVRVDPQAAQRIHPDDRVRTIRALEVWHKTGRPISSFWGSEKPFPWPLVKVGLVVDRKELHRRIVERVDRMFAQGLVEEVKALVDQGLSPETQAGRTIGYREFFAYFRGECTLQDVRRKIVQNTKAYARRQMAFFRAEEGVQWLDTTGLSPGQVATEVLKLWRQADPSLQ